MWFESRNLHRVWKLLDFGAITVPYAVFKAVVGCSGENKVGPAQLLDVSQSLELGCVDELGEKRVQLNVTMDGVIKDLAGDTIIIKPQNWFELHPHCKHVVFSDNLA